MDASDIIALILGGLGFMISIISLVFAPRLTLKSKQLEKRLEYRFELFQKILALWELISRSAKEHEIKPLLTEINKLIQLFGYNSEIKSFRELIDSYNHYGRNPDEVNRQKLKTRFEDFFSTSFNRYRKEIVLDKLKN